MVREPLGWTLATLERRPVLETCAVLRHCERGPWLADWDPPSWLLPHQVAAARRLAASLRAFGGALLADAVGMGKTYVALAVAGRYSRVATVVPACLVSQWVRAAGYVSVPIVPVSHERLSRGGRIPASDLVVIDEAHRLRNPSTIRYDRCVRTLGSAHVLLLTATPVANGARDLLHLLRLFLADNALAFLGLPALGSAETPHHTLRLARAATRLTVARPAEVAVASGASLPTIRDGSVIRAPTTSWRTLRMLQGALEGLTFPGAPPGARHLLRAQLWHRLASSMAALRQTLRRHLAYADRAATVGSGVIGRRMLRFLLGPGDGLQLELDGLLAGARGPALTLAELEAERERLLSLLDRLPDDRASPKSRRLAAVLGARPRRAIVFCGSGATAHELARHLGWKRLAVAASGKARIASGPISLEAVLDRFAPTARRFRRVADGRDGIDLLIATDLVSEGLDLQDADTVVHYDLPWSPVRVAQRIGRIARLGSLHPAADVLWFAPPASIERRLRLEQRLMRKVAAQLALAVPSTSAPGRAHIVNATLAARERLCATTTSSSEAAPIAARGAFSLVRGPAVLAAGVRWITAAGAVDELLAFAGSPPRPVESYHAVSAVLERLWRAPPVTGGLPPDLRTALLTELRTRLRMAAWSDQDPAARRLRRAVLALGHAAGRERDARRLGLLNEVLDRLQSGQRLGAIRALDSAIAEGGSPAVLEAWLAELPPGLRQPPTVRVLALLVGDGSEPAASLGPVLMEGSERQVVGSSSASSSTDEISSSFSS